MAHDGAIRVVQSVLSAQSARATHIGPASGSDDRGRRVISFATERHGDGTRRKPVGDERGEDMSSATTASAERPAFPAETAESILERIQFLGMTFGILLVLGMVVWFYPFDDALDRQGTPLGGDFVMFYVAGRAVWQGESDSLYDEARNQERIRALFPEVRPHFSLPFRYPPFVAVLLAPLAALPFFWAWLVFTGLLLLAASGAFRTLSRELTLLRSPWRRPLLWGLIGCPLVVESLIGGQASLLAVLIASLVIANVLRGRPLSAGACLALGIYKPNVLALFGLGCLLRYPRLLRSAVPVGVALLGLSWLVTGPGTLLEYGQLGTRLATQTWTLETPQWKVHGLASWLDVLVPGQGRRLTLVLGLAGVLLVVSRWRRATGRVQELLAFSALLVMNSLCNPYVPIYDLALLVIALLLTAEALLLWTISESEPACKSGSVPDGHVAPSSMPGAVTTQVLLAVICLGPHVSQAVAKATGLQPFALVLLPVFAWLMWTWSCVARAERARGHGRMLRAGEGQPLATS